ncbi:MAG: aminopeptidase P family protein [Candidatus Thermoplasmatota archaeon]|nr:aminopeptidase P family protein [Candidatus Thermoplasmatota archaeon]MBS3789656.1 aminopeptidase P family protein [Candidatus Thermoplasmatota archaeon]
MDFMLDSKVYERKKEKLLTRLEEKEMEAVCLFSPTFIFNLTGFAFLPTERPIAYLLDKESEKMVIPRLEKEHLESREQELDEVITYPDYPGEKHPMKFVQDMIEEKEYEKIAVDQDGYGSGYGYFGPSLSELIDIEVEDIRLDLEKFFSVKEEEEIELMKESAKWDNLGLKYLQEETEPGLSEIEASMRASLKASQSIIRAFGPKYEQTGSGFPITVGYRGQVGEGSSLPHAIASNETINEGDVLVNGAGVEIGGYSSELERTWIVGEPTEEQKKYFELAVKAQDIAFDVIEAGKKLSEVDRRVYKFYEEEDIEETWRHHTGHGLGTRLHEPPFLDVGEDWELKENMVLSVEPGIYVKDYAGFRHSDTVVVKKNGVEILTYYPRSLEESTISVK